MLVGYRFTQNELFSVNSSARLTLLYNASERSSIKLVLGQAFRAPTLYELFFQTPWSTLSVFGNKDLKPETSNSVELSYLIAFGDVFVQALAFYSTYDQKITLTRRNLNDEFDKSLAYVNGNQYEAYGGEIELKYNNPGIVDAFLNYAYESGDHGDRSATEGEHYNIKYVPSHTASLGLARQLWYGFALSTVVQYIHSRNGPFSEIDPQVTWDACLRYRQKLGEHAFYAKNILNDEIQIPDYARRTLNSYPSGYGRTLFYSFRMKF